ncbi:MAG TPA: TraB/GumN family protein [Flavisolibacter sp.]|nr:TraB/GumN family protein [Flavisolibacter sp.]
MLRTILLTALFSGITLLSPAQNRPAPKGQGSRKPVQGNYSSLLWEITGNGLTRPSYLFGTMHVSDKLAFHLGDSFYNALKSVQVVALETNPEYWQDNFSKSFRLRDGERWYGRGWSTVAFENYYPVENLSLTSFSLDNYNNAIKAALAVEPSMVNGMLYRTYGTSLDDFEEDTFLDMYIFQAGKKLGKRLTGVENFEESEKLVREAYREMLRDRNIKRRSYDFEENIANPKKIEDAYRKGDLDQLDSLQLLNVTSEAFEEKFLYRRNEIQANSIDTILKKASLFAAVGAAHLPGKRGVIEMLRKMGYKLRPVHMDDRNSRQKEAIDRTRFATSFTPIRSDDGFYQVSIPGKKFYRFTGWSGMDVLQYADIVNGAYYMVTRIKTHSSIWGHDAGRIHRQVDSFMYENVPGKLISRTAISKNGYKGWEIRNRTRRGDHQRYQVFVTPFELLIFKMSGNGEYVNEGAEAQAFFGSINIQEHKAGEWLGFTPSTGGFSVSLPQRPFISIGGNGDTKRLEYAAFDKQGNNYLIMQASLRNYSYAEEDSFVLNLMDESYAYSGFIDRKLERRFTRHDGFPALESRYRHKDSSYSTVRHIIRGALHYVLLAHYKKEDEQVKQFFRSFSIAPFVYPEARLQTDTVLKFTVMSPYGPDTTNKDEQDIMDSFEALLSMRYEDDDFPDFYTRQKSAMIGNDTTGEKITISYTRHDKYAFEKDSAGLWKRTMGRIDSSLVFKRDKQWALANGFICREMHLTDTGSSRLILSKWFYKDGHCFNIAALTDSLTGGSAFLRQFFSSFTPADSLKGESLLTRKTAQFFADFFSSDSAVAKNARRARFHLRFDSADAPDIEKAIARLSWDTKSYLNIKSYFISQLAATGNPAAVPYLKELYYKIKDTADFQHAILAGLLSIRTKASFSAFKDLVVQEPPIGEGAAGYTGSFINSIAVDRWSLKKFHYLADEYNMKWSQLYDSLELTKQILPELLPLMEIDDYRPELLNILTTLVDSGLVAAKDYEAHFSKIYLDARQLLKKQLAAEEQLEMEKLARSKERPQYVDEDEDYFEEEEGNYDLERHAILMLPFYEKHPGVPAFFAQLMRTGNKRLLYRSFVLLLRNNRPVADSLFSMFAKLDTYRGSLYSDLVKMKKESLFPEAFKTQELMARSNIATSRDGYGLPDTLVYAGRLQASYKQKKGFVYFFKYKKMRDDPHWQLAAGGLYPEGEVWVDEEKIDLVELEGYKLDGNRPVQEQMDNMLREMLIRKRASATDFYEPRIYDAYKVYLPDMVKRYRYRD